MVFTASEVSKHKHHHRPSIIEQGQCCHRRRDDNLRRWFGLLEATCVFHHDLGGVAEVHACRRSVCRDVDGLIHKTAGPCESLIQLRIRVEAADESVVRNEVPGRSLADVDVDEGHHDVESIGQAFLLLCVD